MIDHLRLAIPFHDVYVKELSGINYLHGDPSDYGFPMATRHVTKGDDGTFTVGDLYSPYESLPSSYTPMAVKLFNNTINCKPYVEIKGSPAKIMQGHNVYGSDSIYDCAFEMLGLLLESIPAVAKYLDLANTEVRHIDCTYSSQVSNANLIPKIIDYLSRVSHGQTKATADKKYRTTAYWGGEHSRLIQMKAYGKFVELMNQQKEFAKLAKQGDAKAKYILTEVYTPELLAYAECLMRWEARIKARKLERMGIPYKLVDLINYQIKHPSLIKDLWSNAFQPIFKTLEGQTMPYANDDEIYQLLKSKLKTVTAKGRISYTRANNAMNFYHLVRDVGLEVVKNRYSNATYHRNIKNLVDAGLSKAWLQNLHTDQKGTVIPLVRYAHVNFNAQAPADYIPPTTQYQPLTLVA